MLGAVRSTDSGQHFGTRWPGVGRCAGQGDLAPEASERGRPDVEGQVCQGRSTPPKMARVAGVSSENGIRKT